MNGRLNSGCSNFFVIVVLLFLAAIYMIGDCNDGHDSEMANLTQEQRDSVQHRRYMKELEHGAEWAAKQYVKETMKSPSTADFASSSLTKYKGDSTYIVQSYVDGQNSFGATKRMSYEVELTYMGGDVSYYKNWFVLKLKTDD